jgi:lipopolysaccharide export system ATP-binding protein
MLIIKNLSKSYKSKQAVAKFSMVAKQGKIHGLLGPNGAGKTTSFYMISGLIAPDQGTIMLDDFDITHASLELRIKAGIAYLPQEPSIFKTLSVWDNLYAVLELRYPKKEAQELCADLLKKFDLLRLRDSFAGALSGGERRKLEMARTLSFRPKFVLLDEPFAGVDPIAASEMIKLIKQLTKDNIGVIITDHNVHYMLEAADEMTVMHDGRILAQGGVQDIKNNEQVIQYYLGNTIKH